MHKQKLQEKNAVDMQKSILDKYSMLQDKIASCAFPTLTWPKGLPAAVL